MRMANFRPKYITFDCYGTLTNFQMAEAARDLYSEQLDEPRMAEFIKNFAAYRLDEIMGDWKPYAEVVHNSLERTCKRNGIKFREEAARLVYERVPTWGPHADVPAGLAKVAKEIPLVILSNAMNSQIMSNVEKLGAPSMRSTRPSRRRPTSRASRPSNICSICSAAARRTFSTARPRSATT
ncbi:Haloacid dehalogenase type II (plasmid) [Sinorhizobium fredii CCBAU 25509]|nr:Haloacid dehalogenase type II [Sinorhizobium fredii CCBAU 25509]